MTEHTTADLIAAWRYLFANTKYEELTAEQIEAVSFIDERCPEDSFLFCDDDCAGCWAGYLEIEQ